MSLAGQDLFPRDIGLRGAVATLAAFDSNELLRGTLAVLQNEVTFGCEFVFRFFLGVLMGVLGRWLGFFFGFVVFFFPSGFHTHPCNGHFQKVHKD